MAELFPLKIKSVPPPFVVVDVPKNVQRPVKIDNLAKRHGGKLADTDEVEWYFRYHYTFLTVDRAKKFQTAVALLRLPIRAVTLIQ